MTKVLFLLSAVVMVVAGFFSYQNRESFVQTRVSRIENDSKINVETNNLKVVGAAIKTEVQKINQANDDLNREKGSGDQLKLNLTNRQRELDRVNQEIATNKTKITEYNQQLEGLPQGMTLENITEGINKLKADIATAESKATQLKEQLVAKEGEVKKAQDDLGAVKKRMTERAKSFDRNSFSGTVVAVNNDWGFVVINSGSDRGITTETKLLVTRGEQTIGKLNIVNVEGGRTLANIDQKSLRSGLSIAPGDKVILEVLYQ